MTSCLGLYIEENIIKYAKVSKDNDVVKIDSFGLKFYDRLDEAIEQVIAETYSYKTPISINSSNETYNYFYVFNQLTKKDMNNYIKTEFESLCYEKELNVENFESRYVLVEDLQDKEKIKAIHISVNKSETLKKAGVFGGYKLSSISPISLDVANLLEIDQDTNSDGIAIVNIEEETTVTTIIDHKIYDVTKIDSGTREILSKINAKENSYSKAYEICKNSTIYTSEGKDLQYEENVYLDDIMPTLYNIVGQVKKILTDSLNKIDRVYITGTAAVINNIDIYFQEYLEDYTCEIMKPYFLKTAGLEVNVKDYIEVNSAIALALQGLGDGLKGINFKKQDFTDRLPEWLNIELPGSKGGKPKTLFSVLNLKMDFKDALSEYEKGLIRGVVGILLLIIIYSVFAVLLTSQIQDKVDEVSLSSTHLATQIAAINADKESIDDKTGEYEELLSTLNEKSATDAESKRLKYSIPTLLNQIMYSIPVNVQLTSITTSGTTVTIVAQSDKYEPIGIFIAKLSTDGILLNVSSDKSEKVSIWSDEEQAMVEVVVVTIEGEVP